MTEQFISLILTASMAFIALCYLEFIAFQHFGKTPHGNKVWPGNNELYLRGERRLGFN